MENVEKKIIGDHVAVIAVDIDGVLALDENKPMSKRRPYDEMKKVLDKFVMRGYNVILYTSRDISRKAETEEWLLKNGFYKNGFYLEDHFHDIVYNKLKYDFILDNRAINISDPHGDIDIEMDFVSDILDLCL